MKETVNKDEKSKAPGTANKRTTDHGLRPSHSPEKVRWQERDQPTAKVLC